ncbi:MAG: hypothetical protein ACP5F8_01290 [Candidatus Aenigmatarchaeota archaeon]
MKGQAALEFLMTYGWAILIVIAVVAALYAMGVFKLPTGGLAPCSPCFPPGSDVAYVSHNATHVLLKVGANKIKINGEEYNPGETAIYDISNTCGNWTAGSCQVNVTYSIVVDSTEMIKQASATLHKTW